MTSDPNSPVARIMRRLNLLIAATVVLYGAVAYVAVDANRSTTRNTDALCTFRGDLEKRVASTNDFLKKHPEGFAGIPAVTLKASADQQQRTILALSDLNCD